MKKHLLGLIFLSYSTTIFSASFPHKSAIFQTTTSGSMIDTITDSYVYYNADKATITSAEWIKQKSPVKGHRLNLTKDGVVYSVDFNKNQCTKINVKTITDSINDPEAFAKNLRKQMGLIENGSCDGAGLKGVKYTSSFSEMCIYKDIFLLWQNVMGITTQVTKVTFDTDIPADKINLPSGIKCIDGPDLSKGMTGMMQDYRKPPSSGSTTKTKQKQSPQDMDEAMKKAKEAMKSFGDMFK